MRRLKNLVRIDGSASLGVVEELRMKWFEDGSWVATLP